MVPVPVAEGRYGGMGAGKDCLLWVRSPVAGVLGDGRAGTGDKADRPVLERYDLVRRKLDVIADPVSSYAVTGDGTRLVVRDGSTLRAEHVAMGRNWRTSAPQGVPGRRRGGRGR